MKTLLLIAALAATGCAHGWRKAGATGSDFQDAKISCQAGTFMDCAYAHGYGLPICHSISFKRCMNDRGWE